MRAVGRSLVACLSALSLVCGALVAPLTHVHADAADHGTHHRGTVVHAHAAIHGHADTAGHHETAMDEGTDDDGSARALDAFQIVGGWTQPVIGLPPESAAAPLPATRPVTVRPPAQHGHDPPLARVGPSRAPPSPLA
jgi:hypothetical protein